MNSKQTLLVVVLAALIYAQGVFTVQSATDPAGDYKGPRLVYAASEPCV
jgi:carbohydrate-binding DOMON domain-containing protein